MGKVCGGGQGCVTASSETCHLPNCVPSKGQTTFARYFLSTQVEMMHAQGTVLDNTFFCIPQHCFKT